MSRVDPIFIVLIATSLFPPAVRGQQITPATYYVDCAGDDRNDGMSPQIPWRSVGRAQSATLLPGDALLFRRGCLFSEPLVAPWSGTPDQPITIGAYGSGAKPLISLNAQGTIQNAVGVAVTGSYLTIEHLAATLTNPYREPTCTQADGTGIPLGWYVGFSLGVDGDPAHHVVLNNVEAHHLALGVHIADESSNNIILNSYFHDLNALWRLDVTKGALGALGVNLHGDDHEVGYNLFERNVAACTLSDSSDQHYSAPFEIFNANRGWIHHNRAFEHRKHAEFGHDATHTTDDNVLAYNLFVSSRTQAVGPNVHGATNPFGPVNRTQIYNNIIVFAGASSQALVCDCSGGATIKNNILIADWKAAFYKGAYAESNNVYWKASGSPLVQFANDSDSLSTASHKINPQFVDDVVPYGDYHLKATSPAIDAGTSESVTKGLNRDLDGISVPQGKEVDIGAYEYSFPSNPTVCLGDTTQDRVRGLSDVIRCIRYLVGLDTLTSAELTAADANQDSSVDLSDVIRIIRDLLGLEPLPVCQ